MLIFILIFIAWLFLTIFIEFKTKKENCIQFLMINSSALKKIIAINSKYNFYKSANNYNEKHTYDNEIFYDSISCEDYLIYQLQFKKYNVEKEIKFIYSNKTFYKLYCEEISKINQLGDYLFINFNLNHKVLLNEEKALIEKCKLKPMLDFGINITLYCSKINGDIYKKKRQFFNSKEIMCLIHKLNNRTGAFYNDKEIWDSICRVERGKVSNKMRFAIYERDGNRCRKCGISGRLANLEIDHIKPIAKGGKSTYDNLQTLCRRCNKIKGDSY